MISKWIPGRIALACVALGLTLVGCSNESDASAQVSDASTQASESPEASAAPTSEHGPTLLTLAEGETSGMQAIVSGVLELNDAGCYAVRGVVLVAPYGSRTTDQQKVDLRGIGVVGLGEKLVAGGGRVDDAGERAAPKDRRCFVLPGGNAAYILSGEVP